MAAPVPAPGAAEPSMFVELRISCQQLVNRDVTSLSDPMAVLHLKSPSGQWVELGRTEMIKDCLNPKFVTPVRMQYRFETVQNVRFTIYDVDDPRGSLERADFLGCCETTLAEIITNRSGLFNSPLADPSRPGKRGTIQVVAEEVREANEDVTMVWEANNLDKKDLFGKSDPYLVFSQMREGATVAVHKTEYIPETLAPHWQPFTLSMQKLCNGDLDRPILIECFDWNKRSAHELIGKCETSMRALTKPDSHISLPLTPAKKSKKPNAGTLVLSRIEVVKNPTFIEFLRGGCEISLVVAIDFTASNGPVNTPTSLHYINPSMPNAYQQAITSVGSILAPYDHDGLFPVYGFGARMPDGTVSHCFALNGNPSNPEVAGVPGILEAYQRAILATTLYGPTLFAQIINTSGQIAAMNSQDPTKQKYFVLLIITDGEVNDMQPTMDQLVYAANNLPISVVIVGVGNADFGKMEALDADDKSKSEQALRASDGSTATRDIVQFVPFNKYAALGAAKLAEDTLAEIPGQLLSFFKKRGIKPHAAPAPTYVPPPPQ